MLRLWWIYESRVKDPLKVNKLCLAVEITLSHEAEVNALSAIQTEPQASSVMTKS